MYMGKPAEGDRTKVGGTSKTRLYVGLIGYKIEKKAERANN
jgi:hypothetical protein